MRAAPIQLARPPFHFNRVAFSATHVAANPFADREPFFGPSIDWSATLRFRRHILDLGLGIAEAMDTAQRGNGLGWFSALELIRRTLDVATAQERDRIFFQVGMPTRSNQ